MDTSITESTHPVLRDMPADWPYFLGYNRVIPKDTATTVLKLDDDPLLSVWQYGEGRSAAFTTDCAPHWGPKAWLEWNGYNTFWNNLIAWVSNS